MAAALAGLLLLLLAGCGTTAVTGSGNSSRPETRVATPTAEDEPPLLPKSLERRAEAHALYADAVRQEWDEDWAAAAAAYHQAALADPANEPLVLEAAQRLVLLKESGKALEVLSNATASAKASGAVFAQLGRLHLAQGRTNLASQSFRAAIHRSPKLLIGYQFLATLHLQARQQPEGLKVLDQAAKQSGVDVGFLIGLGELYTAFFRAGASPSAKGHALEAYKRAANPEPTNMLAQLALAEGFAGLGETDRATELYLRLLEQRPDLPGLREKLAEIYLRKQDRQRAAEQLDAIIRDQPTNPQAHFFRGSLAFEDKDYKTAVDCLKKAVLLNPGFEPAYHELAAAQINLNQPREALATLERARPRFKEGFVTELYSAMAFSKLKEYTNALRHLTTAEVIARATETNRLTHVFYFQLGAACERAQRPEEAEQHFRKCLEMAPDFAEALNYLGYMWAERGTNLDEARRLIEKAVQLEPTNAAFLDSMGWVLFQQGHAEEALPWLIKAIKHSEEPDATLYDHLGDVYAALKQPERAREAWAKSVGIEPNEKVRQKLEAVRATAPAPAPP